MGGGGHGLESMGWPASTETIETRVIREAYNARMREKKQRSRESSGESRNNSGSAASSEEMLLEFPTAGA